MFEQKTFHTNQNVTVFVCIKEHNTYYSHHKGNDKVAEVHDHQTNNIQVGRLYLLSLYISMQLFVEFNISDFDSQW